MTEEQPTTRRIGVTYEHKISDGNYGGQTASAWVSDEVPVDAGASDVSKALNELFDAAKASVFDQLGIEFVVDESGVMRPKHEPVASVESRLGQEFGAQRVSGGNSGGHNNAIKVMNESDQQGALPEALVAACNRKGITAVWDNRKARKRESFTEAVKRGETSLITGEAKGAVLEPPYDF